MIFLSHTYADKTIVREIAQRLEEIFGREKVFYDEWSIQPGDSIIEKMNSGIEQCQFFFYFVSKNSLVSKMVNLEWQSAIIKKNKEGIKFIPILLDRSLLPAIISQTLYIDLYSNGLENAFRQIVDVIQGNNTFRSKGKISNLIANVKKELNFAYIEISAKYYIEPYSEYGFWVKNDINELEIQAIDNSYMEVFHEKNVELPNGNIVNFIGVKVNTPVSPDFPLQIGIMSTTNMPVEVVGALHITSKVNSKSKFEPIPIKWN